MAIWILGEFRTEGALLAAARRLRELHPGTIDIHSPAPVHGADEALGLRKSRVPLFALLGGLLGAATGYGLQWWMVGVNWPINVGNRPPHSPPAFVPITFELGVLFSSLTIFFGILLLFGFPRLHHPVFQVESFRTASIDGLWVSVRTDASAAASLAEEMKRLGAAQVTVVREDEEVRS